MTAAGINPPEIGARDMEVLAEKLRQEHGFDLLSYKPRLLKRRIQSRLRVRECPNLGTYLKLLRVDAAEVSNLLRTLTIHVSGFFRNEETFEFLRERVFPGLLRARREDGQELVLVSAGCAEGEEPYSLAMLLLRHFGRELDGLSRRIIGLDVDGEVLDRARRGEYEPERIADLPSAYRRFFTRKVDRVEVAPEVRAEVEFRQCDLKECVPATGADLIMCRNVLIYFKRGGQRRILRGLREALKPGGFLALGKTESLIGDLRSGFRVLDLTEHVYCKAGEEPCGWR